MSDTYRRYRVWLHIRGSVVKPCYDGYVDCYAPSYEEAGEWAIREVRRKAHWDSPPEAFRVDRIEPR